jgi:hypothetical protein
MAGDRTVGRERVAEVPKATPRAQVRNDDVTELFFLGQPTPKGPKAKNARA